jgi:hypothetical protein
LHAQHGHGPAVSDFLNAQGTTSVFPNGLNPGGPPGLPDELGAATSTATFLAGTALFERIDYTGQDAAFLGLNLGTTTSGSISERSLANGTAQDTVILHTHNAFAWANFLGDGSNANPPVIFGFLPSQLVANPNLIPPVGNVDLQAVINIPHPGAPLPDLVVLNVLGGVPGDSLVSLSVFATARGPTPSGQQATMVVAQTGVLNRTPNLIGDFGYTAEVIDIQTKNGSAPAAATAEPAAASLAAAPSSGADSSHSAIDAVFAPFLDDPLAWIRQKHRLFA